MRGAGFAVTKTARHAARTIGGTLNHEDKALANRRNRRHLRQDLQRHGEEADLLPKLWTDYDVI
jgi:hypothetical protein